MNIVDHGSWAAYTPKPEDHPAGAPINALFARRESDGVDWYDYVADQKSFGANTVKFAAIYRGDHVNGYIVGPAVYLADRMFPAGHIVAEITDYTGSDPQADFGNKVFDPAAATFSEQPPVPRGEMPLEIRHALDAITARFDKLEGK